MLGKNTSLSQLGVGLLEAISPEDFSGPGQPATLLGASALAQIAGPESRRDIATKALWMKGPSGQMLGEVIDKKHNSLSRGDLDWTYQPERVAELALKNSGTGGYPADVTETAAMLMSGNRYSENRGKMGVEEKVYLPTTEELSAEKQRAEDIMKMNLPEPEKQRMLQLMKDEMYAKRRERVRSHYRDATGRESSLERSVMRLMEAQHMMEDQKRYPMPESIERIPDEAEKMLRYYQWHKYRLDRGNQGILDAMTYQAEANNKIANAVHALGEDLDMRAPSGSKFDLRSGGRWTGKGNAKLMSAMMENRKNLLSKFRTLPKDDPRRNDPAVIAGVKAANDPELRRDGKYYLIAEMFAPEQMEASLTSFKRALGTGGEISRDAPMGGEDQKGSDQGYVEIPVPVLEETAMALLKEKHGGDMAEVKEDLARQMQYFDNKREALESILQDEAPDQYDELKREYTSKIHDSGSIAQQKNVVDQSILERKAPDRMPPNPTDMFKKPSNFEPYLQALPKDQVKSAIPDEKLPEFLDGIKRMMADKRYAPMVPKDISSVVRPDTQIQALTPDQIERIRDFSFTTNFKKRFSDMGPEGRGLSEDQYKVQWRNSLSKLVDASFEEGLMKDMANVLIGRTPVRDDTGAEFRMGIPKSTKSVDQNYAQQKKTNGVAQDLWFQQNQDRFNEPMPELGNLTGAEMRRLRGLKARMDSGQATPSEKDELNMYYQKADPGSPIRRFRKAYDKVWEKMVEKLSTMPQDEYDGMFGGTKIARTDVIKMVRVARFVGHSMMKVG